MPKSNKSVGLLLLKLRSLCCLLFALKVNVYKQPITDSSKHSKKGLLSLELDEKGKYVTIEEGRGNADKVTLLLWELSQRFCLTKYLDELEVALRAPRSK